MLDTTNADAGADAAQAAEGTQGEGTAAATEGQLGGGAGAAEGQPKAEGEGQSKADDEPKVTKQPWAHKRIDELTAQRYEQQRRADEATRERDELRKRLELYEHAQRGEGQAEGQRQPEPSEKPPTQAEIDRMVAERVTKAARVAEFNRAADATFAEGVKAFGEQAFRASLQTIGQALGTLPMPLVEAAIETGSAHTVLHALGQNPEEAMRIMTLSPTRMAVAVAKIAARPAEATPVSRAPAPIKPIAGTGRAEADPDKMSTAEWMAARREGKVK